jgi:hypothetical protein
MFSSTPYSQTPSGSSFNHKTSNLQISFLNLLCVRRACNKAEEEASSHHTCCHCDKYCIAITGTDVQNWKVISHGFLRKQTWNLSRDCYLHLFDGLHLNTLQPAHKIIKFSLGLYKINLVTICVIKQINVSQLWEGSIKKQYRICMRFWLFPFQQSY